MKMKLLLVCSIFNSVTLIAQTTDYTQLENWAAHPLKYDMADSVPADLKKLETNSTSKKANVFFIHPTSYTQIGAQLTNGWNAGVTDEALNKETDERTILFQASCFNYQTNVYAPRYRQAHYQSFLTNSSEGKAALALAYSDVRAAFLEFLKTADTSLPFIIAAHSQGTMHGGTLIKEFIEGKSLQQKMICAYLIGMPVRKNYFSVLKPCGSATQTNCFVSWRTYLEGEEGEAYIQEEAPNSVYVTNPLIWNSSTEKVSRAQNKGSVLLKYNEVWKQVSGTQIHNNILWITKPKFKLSFLVRNRMTNYHIADINMFYVNIRENVGQRIAAMKK